MKATLILCAIVVSVFAVPHEEWHAFKQLHGKAYTSEFEEIHRKKIYGEHKARIDQHNEHFLAGRETYELGMNEFSDMTHEEFSSMFTGGLDANAIKRELALGSRGLTLESLLGDSDSKSIPDNLDWRDYGLVFPPLHQGLCNACYAFSATGALEAQMQLKLGYKIKLSEQNIMDCSRKYGNKGCNKGLMDFAFKYIKDNDGIEASETYPYEAADDVCRYESENSVFTDGGSITLEQGNEEKLKKAVAFLGPISTTIYSIPLQFYKSGVFYNTTCKTEIDHAVLTIGYGTDENTGEDYFLIKNSWGTKWGDHGFAKIARNKENHCGVATYSSWPLPTSV